MSKSNTKEKPKSNRGRKPGIVSELAKFFKPLKEKSKINPGKFLDDRVKMFIRKYFLKSKMLKIKHYPLYLEYISLCAQEKNKPDSNIKANILRQILSLDYRVIDEESQKFKAKSNFVDKCIEMLNIQYAGIYKDQENFYFHLLFDEMIEYIKKGVKGKRKFIYATEDIMRNNCGNKKTVISCQNNMIEKDSSIYDNLPNINRNENIIGDYTGFQKNNEDDDMFAVNTPILDSCSLFEDFLPENPNPNNTPDAYLSLSKNIENRENSERERKNPSKWKKLQANS
ncbi:hypothetical protein SteCoe_24896 [Stentor coeruleus]|uniref:Uncharacterized protein n=1 Tax=Stentor coeruleus TaxID=5963 RepID=A0A1R2BGH0_9CILI|nr:hypothetical protein SteCoe_24896 [Stentor coeruleus]